MSIRADVIRGHTDAVILAQLLRRDSYGYEIKPLKIVPAANSS